MTHTQHTAEHNESPERRNIAQWIEKNIGGRVTQITQLRRWRPIWIVDIDNDRHPRRVLVKNLRTWDSIPYSLEHEMVCLQKLEANGVLVPHVYGMMESPPAFVMDWVEADDRGAGLVQQGIENKSAMSPERWAASLEYMEMLAAIHKLPVAQFASAEVKNPTDAEGIALTNYNLYVKMLEDRNAMDALMEFLTRWIRRNVPKHRARPAFLMGDCGQFLNKGSKVVAIIDVEIAHIGDPMFDLACFRGRHPVENMGDLPELYRHYAKALGEPLDLPVLAYHSVVFLAMALIAPILAVIEKHPGGDWVEGALQISFIGRRAFEALAELVEVELDDHIELPAPHVLPLEELAYDKLIAEINHLPLSEETFTGWQRGILASLPQFLRAQARYGRWLEEEELREVAAIVGQRPADLAESDKVLKAFIQKAGPEHDKALVKLFYRRLLRQCLVLAGPNPPQDHLLLMKVEPIMGMRT